MAKAGSIEQAATLVQTVKFDLAVLDVKVADQPITSIAAMFDPA